MQQRRGRLRRRTEDEKPLKRGYGEQWKRLADLINLLMRKFSGE